MRTTTHHGAVTLHLDHHGHVDRRQTLGAFADDREIESIFGPDRRPAAQSIAAHLRGIIPTRDMLIRNAWGYSGGFGRRIAAYRNGRKHLLSAYAEYGDLAATLPDPADIMDPSADPAVGPDALVLKCDTLGYPLRREVLAAFAEGREVAPIYGVGRRAAVWALVQYVSEMAPGVRNGDAAWPDGSERRAAAYRNGRRHLMDHYGEYARVRALSQP